MKRSGGVPRYSDSALQGWALFCCRAGWEGRQARLMVLLIFISLGRGSDQCGKAVNGAKQPIQLRTVPTNGLATSPLWPLPWPGPAQANEAQARSGSGSAPLPPLHPPSSLHGQGLTARSCSLTSAWDLLCIWLHLHTSRKLGHLKIRQIILLGEETEDSWSNCPY